MHSGVWISRCLLCLRCLFVLLLRVCSGYIATFVSVIAIFIGMSVPAVVSSAEHAAFETAAAKALDDEAEAVRLANDALGGLNVPSDGQAAGPKLGMGSIVISAAPGVMISSKSSLLGPRYAGASDASVDEDHISPYVATATLGAGLKRTQIAREESW